MTGLQAARWRQIGTNVDLLVAGDELAPAREAVQATIDQADRALSRFRPDSELSLLNASSSRSIVVNELLARAIECALIAARDTGGLVDPSVGRAVRLSGYDRDWAQLRGSDDPRPIVFEAVPGWQAIDWHSESRTIRIPRSVELDLDATGKALIVDLALHAASAAAAHATGILVSVGGDLAIAGRPPRGGWRVLLAEDSSTPPEADGPVVAISSGALATSSTTVRRWRRTGEELNHLIDPRTGRPVDGPWRTASVVAADCVAANMAATCALVSGDAGVGWLTSHGYPARLVARDGTVTCIGGWPEDKSPAAVAEVRTAVA